SCTSESSCVEDCPERATTVVPSTIQATAQPNQMKPMAMYCFMARPTSNRCAADGGWRVAGLRRRGSGGTRPARGRSATRLRAAADGVRSAVASRYLDPLYRLTSLRSLLAYGLREKWKEGYHAADLRADVMAGLVVGVVALPLSMALA